MKKCLSQGTGETGTLKEWSGYMLAQLHASLYHSTRCVTERLIVWDISRGNYLAM